MTEIIESHVVEPAGQGRDYISQTEADAENVVLGAMMTKALWRSEVRGCIGPETFASGYSQAIWEAIDDADQRGELVENGTANGHPLSVAAALERQSRLTPDMQQRLFQAVQSAPFSTQELTLAIETVRAAHARHVTSATGHRLVRLGEMAQGRSVDELREAAVQATSELTEATRPKVDTDAGLLSDWDDMLERLGEPVDYIRTGFLDLDQILRIQRGHYVVIGARTSVGKSALALNFALNMAKINDNTRCTYLSYEMSREDCQKRILCASARVRNTDLRNGTLTDDDWARIAKAHTTLPESLLIPSRPSRRLQSALATIYQEGAKMQATGGKSVVFIDYAQQLTLDGAQDHKPRREQLQHVTNSLQAAAQETGVAVVALAQLNRGPETREGGLPRMSDIRDCDAFAHDVDAGILIHRPDKLSPDDPRMGEADLIVDKNRHGPTAKITVAQQLHYSRFVDMAQE